MRKQWICQALLAASLVLPAWSQQDPTLERRAPTKDEIALQWTDNLLRSCRDEMALAYSMMHQFKERYEQMLKEKQQSQVKPETPKATE